MPGAGKSTWGKKLANALQYSFIDLDEMIAQNEQQSISSIFESKGEDYFRKLEHQYLLKTITLNKVVISCGGGIPCYNNNMNLINENGASIYINVKKNILVSRILSAKRQRPLFLGLDKTNIEKKVEELLAQRNVFYKQATYTFNIPEETIQTFVSKAVQLIFYMNK